MFYGHLSYILWEVAGKLLCLLDRGGWKIRGWQILLLNTIEQGFSSGPRVLEDQRPVDFAVS